MTQTRHVLRILVTFLIVPFILWITLFILPFDKKFAYYFVRNECDNKGAWIYDRLFRNSKEIDIAFVGSSRTKAAINDQKFVAISGASGKKQVVANLGYCRWGRNLDYVITKDIFKNKLPGILVLEVHEEEERLSHIDFPYLADSRDVLLPVLFFNQSYFSDVFHSTIVRIEMLKHKLFANGNTGYEREKDYGYVPSDLSVNDQQILEFLKREKGKKHYRDSKPERWINSQFPEKYIEKIAAICMKNNCRLLFLYLPQYNAPELSSEKAKYYERFGEMIVLPASISGSLENWRDPGHFNDKGSERATTYLADILAKYIR